MATREGNSYAASARAWAKFLKGATDITVRRPLWEFPPEAAEPLKHERRRRFKWDIDSEGER